MKALWGILMLLPQSPAYHTLKNRLSAVPEIGLLRLQIAAGAAGKGSGSRGRGGGGGGGGGEQAGGIDFSSLLKTYEKVQARHKELLLRELKGAKKAGA